MLSPINAASIAFFAEKGSSSSGKKKKDSSASMCYYFCVCMYVWSMWVSIYAISMVEILIYILYIQTYIHTYIVGSAEISPTNSMDSAAWKAMPTQQKVHKYIHTYIHTRIRHLLSTTALLLLFLFFSPESRHDDRYRATGISGQVYSYWFICT